MRVIEQFGNAKQRKLASQQFADSGLRDVKKLFKLARSEFLLLDDLEDVLMQIGLELKLQQFLLVQIKLVQNVSPGYVRDEFLASLSRAALQGAV
jgi:hypothetical protein